LKKTNKQNKKLNEPTENKPIIIIIIIIADKSTTGEIEMKSKERRSL